MADGARLPPKAEAPADREDFCAEAQQVLDSTNSQTSPQAKAWAQRYLTAVADLNNAKPVAPAEPFAWVDEADGTFSWGRPQPSKNKWTPLYRQLYTRAEAPETPERGDSSVGPAALAGGPLPGRPVSTPRSGTNAEAPERQDRLVMALQDIRRIRDDNPSKTAVDLLQTAMHVAASALAAVPSPQPGERPLRDVVDELRGIPADWGSVDDPWAELQELRNGNTAPAPPDPLAEAARFGDTYWFALPLPVRQRLWVATDYGRRPAHEALADLAEDNVEAVGLLERWADGNVYTGGKDLRDTKSFLAKHTAPAVAGSTSPGKTAGPQGEAP